MSKAVWSSVGLSLIVGLFGLELACSSEGTDSPEEAQGTTVQELVQAPANGGVVTIAGTGAPGLVDSASATTGKLNDPAGVAVASNGTIYVADWGNNAVRRITTSGALQTLFKASKPNIVSNPRAETPPSAAGTVPLWTVDFGSWGSVSASGAAACNPCGSTYDGSRWFYGLGGTLHQEFSVVPTGPNYYLAAKMRGPSGVVTVAFLDSAGTELTAGTRSITVSSASTWTHSEVVGPVPAGAVKISVSLIAHQAMPAQYFDAVEVRFLAAGDQGLSGTSSVAVDKALDGTERIIVGANKVYARSAAGASLGDLLDPPGVVTSIAPVSDGTLYFVDSTQTDLYVRSSSGVNYRANVGGVANAEPVAVAAKTQGTGHRLWVSYRSSSAIRIYDCPTSTTADAIVTCTLTSSKIGAAAGFVDDMDGTAGGERLRFPHALAIGRFGDLLIAEEGNSAIRRSFLPLTRTSAGSGTRGFLDGASNQARFSSPSGVAAAPDGSVIVADRLNNRIRKILCAASNACVATAGMACTVLPVEDGQSCTTDSCLVLAVNHAPLANGSSCSDGNACTGPSDTCTSGVCGGPTVPTDDGNLCTVDGCDPGSGVTHTPKTFPDVNTTDCFVPECDPATGNARTATAPEGTVCGINRLCNHQAVCEAAAPPATAPVLDGTAGTSLGDSTKYIYEGANPVQSGVTAGYIKVEHAGWLVGYVKTAAGNPMSNVEVSIVGNASYGKTFTRSDGRFDLIVNGGTTHNLRFAKVGHLNADRRLYVGWQQTASMTDVVLLPLDPNPNTIIPNSSAQQVAAGSKETVDGERRAVLVLPAHTNAFVNKSDTPLGNMTLRLTEYTGGPNGMKSMPAPIAERTAYTYAVEVSLDEALNADQIDFKDAATGSTKEVYFYLENFIGIPVGKPVATGYYDRQRQAWLPSKSGLVIKILSVTGSVATIDVEGLGNVASSETLAGLGFTTEELAMLKTRYAKDQQLWRVPMTHLTSYDCNLPTLPPPCEGPLCPEPPEPPPPPPPEPDCGSGVASADSTKQGSIIGCDSRTLGERIPLAGSDFTLNYNSKTAPGFAGGNGIHIPLTGAQVHSKLVEINGIIAIAGRRFEQTWKPVPPATSLAPNLAWDFTWDGRDAADRQVIGTAHATFTLTTRYKDAPYGVVDQFGEYPANFAYTINGPRGLYTYNVTWSRPLAARLPEAGWLLGGWTLSDHHFLDIVRKRLYLGSGATKAAQVISPVYRRIMGDGTSAGGFAPDGTSATAAGTGLAKGGGYPRGYSAVAANGDVFVVDDIRYIVRKIDASGNITTVAGNTATSGQACPAPGGGGPALGPGDGEDALLARLPGLGDIAFDSDGSFYVIAQHAVRKVTPKAGGGYKIETFAGTTCTSGNTGDGGAATAARLYSPNAIAVGADHSVYVVDGGNKRVRRIAPDGIIETIAGNGWDPVFGSGSPADQMATSVPMRPLDLAVTPEGEVYLAGVFSNGQSLTKVDRNGILRVLSATENCSGFYPDGLNLKDQCVYPSTLALHADGALVFDTNVKVDIPRKFLKQVDAAGVVTTLSARTEDFLSRAEGLSLSNGPDPWYVSVSPDGSVVLSYPQAYSLYAIRKPEIAADHTCGAGAAFLVPDGEQAYCFDLWGRHKATINQHTRRVVLKFDYEANGRIKTITDAFEHVTKIDKVTASPERYEITAPYGQKTKINIDPMTRYATSIVDDMGAFKPTHFANGLLDKLTDRKNNDFDFDYDANGYLKSDVSPVGTQKLDSVLIANGRSVTHWSPLLRKTTFDRLFDSSDKLRHVTTFPDLSQEVRTTSRDGQDVTIAPDGTVTTTTLDYDYGHNRIAPGTTTIELPSGLTMTTQRQRTGPSAINGGMTEAIKLLHGQGSTPAGTTITSIYSTDGADLPGLGAAQQRVVLSPKGRSKTTLLDAFGRPISLRDGDLTPVTFNYDAESTSEDYGKLKTLAQGTRSITFEYQPMGSGTPTEDAGYVLRKTSPYSKTKFSRDIFGRPKIVVEAEGTTLAATTTLGFDLNGLLKSVKPPSVNVTPPDHGLTYNGVDLLTMYTPPTVAGLFDATTTYVPNADRDITTETRGRVLSSSTPVTVTRTYISSPTNTGQLDTVTFPADGTFYPAGKLDYEYYTANDPPGGAAGRVKQIKGPYTVDTSYFYDGRLTSKLEWSSEVVGNVAWSYNERFLPTKETVSPSPTSGSAAYSFRYDADRLVTCVSAATNNPCNPSTTADLVLTPSDDHGQMTDIVIGATKPVKEHLDYSDSASDDGGTTDTDPDDQKFGELRKQTLTANGAEVASITYDAATERRDDVGRVQFKTEKFGGVTIEISYGYDERNRLDFVETGVATETYGYDLNGNRISFCKGLSAGVACTTSTPGALVGSYDNQDRLTSYGTSTGANPNDMAFTYTANGELLSKSVVTATTPAVWNYGYDPLGNLVTVNRPAGSVLPAGTKGAALYTYMVDGRGRRVGKKEKVGTTTAILKRWLYRNDLNPVAELSSTGTLLARYIYASRKSVPDLVIKGSKTYRLFTDHLGSPRMAVNVDDPNDVPYRVDYSAFGEPVWKGTGLAATPAFDWIPFGFAGGLYDPDTDLVRFGARDYDSTIGRWVSKDPIRFDAIGTNLYVYALNDPVNVADRNGRNPALLLGLCAFGACEGIAAAAAAAATITAGAIACIVSGICEDAAKKVADKIEDACEPKDIPVPNEICPKIAESHYECVYDCPISGLYSTLRWGASEGLYPPDNDICPPSIILQ